MTTLELRRDQADEAAKIQQAIDRLAAGGRVVLPEMEVTLDRGIELRSNVELVGRGEKTVLRKGPGRVYPLTGYHNYGMCDVPLQTTAGLKPGMTVSVLDSSRRGFYSTFARITWIDGDWVGLDRGIEADYSANEAPRLTTAHPLILGHGIENAAVRDLSLDGRREDQDAAMDGCRGACLYLAKSRNVEVTGVRGWSYRGEGLGFQMCADVRIRGCRFDRNAGNGFHPGAGSTNVLVEDCTAEGNEKSGFFFCVRATRVTVSRCTFAGNGNGVSIGTRDCHNLIEGCRIADNLGPGVLVRPSPAPCEVHSCAVRRCDIEGNARAEGDAQVVVGADAHDLILEDNTVAAAETGGRTGVSVAPAARRVFLAGNLFHGTRPDFHAAEGSLASKPPAFECGYGSGPATVFRHLAPQWR